MTLPTFRKLFTTLAIIASVASCAPNHANGPQSPAAKVRVETAHPQLQQWATQNWRVSAHLTRKKLEAVNSGSSRSKQEIHQIFGSSDKRSVEKVRKTLQQMDALFHSGNASIAFFEGHEAPSELQAQVGSQRDEINAYTHRGGSTLFINTDRNEEPIKTFLHEVSHMAARTLDQGYYSGTTYWHPQRGFGPLSPEELIENADTYALFITQ